ncbi:MAG: hypothetical protein ACLR43_15790 [Faecalibacillus faecis]
MDELAELGVAAHWRYKEGKLFCQAEQRNWRKTSMVTNLFLCQMISKMACKYYDSISRDILKPMFMFNATRKNC